MLSQPLQEDVSEAPVGMRIGNEKGNGDSQARVPQLTAQELDYGHASNRLLGDHDSKCNLRCVYDIGKKKVLAGTAAQCREQATSRTGNATTADRREVEQAPPWRGMPEVAARD